ncbi:MAG: hypothetical protein ACE5NL_01300 [Candidatus Hydrothermarchaeaceae archaeon]
MRKKPRRKKVFRPSRLPASTTLEREMVDAGLTEEEKRISRMVERIKEMKLPKEQEEAYIQQVKVIYELQKKGFL